jgi:8-oxo-dGTP pyrophosphatase MutT (NUDIX family)
VREETGLEVSHGRLAAMDFRPAKPGRLAGIRYLFDCGQVSDEALASMKLQPEEISDSRLVPLPEALTLLRGPIRRRVQSAIQGLVYLENGRPA